MTELIGDRCRLRSYRHAVGLLLLAASLWVGCATVEAPAPKGFAPLESDDLLRAVSPDGVVYRVRRSENRPQATLDFWKTALKKRMIDAGYVFMGGAELEANGTPGYLIEVAAPLGEKDFGYLVGVFVRGADLTIVEAAGPFSKLKPRRETLVAAMSRIRWG